MEYTVSHVIMHNAHQYTHLVVFFASFCMFKCIIFKPCGSIESWHFHKIPRENSTQSGYERILKMPYWATAYGYAQPREMMLKIFLRSENVLDVFIDIDWFDRNSLVALSHAFDWHRKSKLFSVETVIVCTQLKSNHQRTSKRSLCYETQSQFI